MSIPVDLTSVRSRAFGFILGCDYIVAPEYPDVKANASQIVFEYNSTSTIITGVLIPTLCLNPPNVPIQNPVIGMLTSHFAISQVAPFPVLTLVACVNPRLTLRISVEPPPTGGLPDDFFGYQRYGMSQTGITYTDCNSTHTIGSGVGVIRTFVNALIRELPGSSTAVLATTYPCQKAVGVSSTSSSGRNNSDAFYKQVEVFYEMEGTGGGGGPVVDPAAWHNPSNAWGATSSIKNTSGSMTVGDGAQYLQLESKNMDLMAYTGNISVSGVTGVNLSASAANGTIDLGVNLAASSVHCEGLVVRTQMPVATYNANMVPESFALKDYVDSRAPLTNIRSSTTMRYKYVAPTPNPAVGEFTFVAPDFYFHKTDLSGRDSSSNFVYITNQSFAGIPMVLLDLDTPANGEIIVPKGSILSISGDVYSFLGNSPTLFVVGTDYTWDHQSIQPSRVVLKDGNPDAILAVGSNIVGGVTRFMADGVEQKQLGMLGANLLSDIIMNPGVNYQLMTLSSTSLGTGGISLLTGATSGPFTISGSISLATGPAHISGLFGEITLQTGPNIHLRVANSRTTISNPFSLTGIPTSTALNTLYHDPVTGIVTTGTAPSTTGFLLNNGNPLSTVSFGSTVANGHARIVVGDANPHVGFYFGGGETHQYAVVVGENYIIETANGGLSNNSGNLDLRTGDSLSTFNSGNIDIRTGRALGSGAPGDLIFRNGSDVRMIIASAQTTITNPLSLTGLSTSTALNTLYHDPITGVVTTDVAPAFGNFVINGGNNSPLIDIRALTAPFDVSAIKFGLDVGQDLISFDGWFGGAANDTVGRMTCLTTRTFEFSTPNKLDSHSASLTFTTGGVGAVNKPSGDVSFLTGNTTSDPSVYGGDITFSVAGGNRGLYRFSKLGTFSYDPVALSGYETRATGDNDFQTKKCIEDNALDLKNKNLEDNTTYFFNSSNNTKKFRFNGGFIAPSTSRVLYIPDRTGSVLVNQTAANHPFNLSGTPVIGDVIRFDGTNWVNFAAPSFHYSTFESNAVSSGGTQNQVNWIQGSLTTTLESGFTIAANNTITYSGGTALTRFFEVTYTATATVGSNDRTVVFSCFKNPNALTNPNAGLRVVGSRTTSILRTSINDTDSVSSTFMVGLILNDTLRFYVSNVEDNGAVTVADLSIAIKAVV